MALYRTKMAVVEKLFTVALAGVGGSVVFVGQGQPQPDGATDVWCRLVKVELSGISGSRLRADGHTETAIATATVLVVAPSTATETSIYALGAAMDAVAAVLGEVRLIDSPLTHEIVTESPDRIIDPEIAEDRQIRAGAVVVRGLVQAVG